MKGAIKITFMNEMEKVVDLKQYESWSWDMLCNRLVFRSKTPRKNGEAIEVFYPLCNIRRVGVFDS